jgi:hypothetical protein
MSCRTRDAACRTRQISRMLFVDLGLGRSTGRHVTNATAWKTRGLADWGAKGR